MKLIKLDPVGPVVDEVMPQKSVTNEVNSRKIKFYLNFMKFLFDLSFAYRGNFSMEIETQVLVKITKVKKKKCF